MLNAIVLLMLCFSFVCYMQPCYSKWLPQNRHILLPPSVLMIILIIPVNYAVMKCTWTRLWIVVSDTDWASFLTNWVIIKLCVLLTVQPGTTEGKWPTWWTVTLYETIYYCNPLHVSSNTVIIIRRSNCINTASGMVFSVSDRAVCRLRRSRSL